MVTGLNSLSFDQIGFFFSFTSIDLTSFRALILSSVCMSVYYGINSVKTNQQRLMHTIKVIVIKFKAGKSIELV